MHAFHIKFKHHSHKKHERKRCFKLFLCQFSLYANRLAKHPVLQMYLPKFIYKSYWKFAVLSDII